MRVWTGNRSHKTTILVTTRHTIDTFAKFRKHTLIDEIIYIDQYKLQLNINDTSLNSIDLYKYAFDKR